MVLSVPPVVGHAADGWESKSFVCRSKCVDRDANFKKTSSAMKRLFLFYIISNGRIVSFKVEINSSLSLLSRSFGTRSRSVYPVGVEQNNSDEIDSSLSDLSRFFGTHPHSEIQWGFLFISQRQKECKFQSRDQFLALALFLTLKFSGAFSFVPQPQKDCKFQSRDQLLALAFVPIVRDSLSLCISRRGRTKH